MKNIILLLLILSQFCLSELKFGIDVLIESDFKNLENKRVGLLTNQTGRTSNGISTFEIFKNQKKFNFSLVLVPEHGYFTAVPAGNDVADNSFDGIPLYSLYGKNKFPGKEILGKCDVIIIDIQDIGIRSYTYISTVYNVLKSAEEHSTQVIVLDRPNPLGGLLIDGNTAEEDWLSFVSISDITYLHGMTIGELSSYFKGQKFHKLNLEIIKMENYKRNLFLEDYKITWIPSSPHIPTINSIKGAATIGIIGELGLISIGIGTTLPFQYIGMPNFDFKKFKNKLEEFNKISSGDYWINLYGVKLVYTNYQPFYGMYKGKNCEGFFLEFEKNARYYSAGIAILFALKQTHPEIFKNVDENSIKMFKKVTGTDKIWNSLEKNSPYIFENSERGVLDFIEKREKYLLY